MKRLFLVSLVFFAWTAKADLQLQEPADLLTRAAQGKNELRDVINEIDQNLTEMRDVQTFDKYFNILDSLQNLYVQTGLGTIYPDAVAKLGGRMVSKGVNWMDVTHDSTSKILYYHKWMADPQVAFAFLYSAAELIKVQNDLQLLKQAASNLEAAMHFADTKWPDQNSLLLLYRSTLSDLAVKILKTPALQESDVLFWLTKIYAADAMTDMLTFLQNQEYAVNVSNKADLHQILNRLSVIYDHVTDPSFKSPDELNSQIGDITVDLIMRSFRIEEKLSDAEFDECMKMMQLKHKASLADSWIALQISPSQDFVMYYVQRAFGFIQYLQEQGLTSESAQLSDVITSKSGALLGIKYGLEGYWEIKDSKGRLCHLNLIYANETYMFADISLQNGASYPLFNVIYDMKLGGFVAYRRGTDPDLASNIPIRIYPQSDGTLKILNLTFQEFDQNMIAKKVQSYPNLMAQKRTNAPDLNGVYKGLLDIQGLKEQVSLAVTAVNINAVGNMTSPDYILTFNYGNDTRGGIIYLTRGNDTVLGSWMHLRMRLDDDGYLRGYVIMGNRGLMPTPIVLKKTLTLTH